MRYALSSVYSRCLRPFITHKLVLLAAPPPLTLIQAYDLKCFSISLVSPSRIHSRRSDRVREQAKSRESYTHLTMPSAASSVHSVHRCRYAALSNTGSTVSSSIEDYGSLRKIIIDWKATVSSTTQWITVDFKEQPIWEPPYRHSLWSKIIVDSNNFLPSYRNHYLHNLGKQKFNVSDIPLLQVLPCPNCNGRHTTFLSIYNHVYHHNNNINMLQQS